MTVNSCTCDQFHNEEPDEEHRAVYVICLCVTEFKSLLFFNKTELLFPDEGMLPLFHMLEGNSGKVEGCQQC